jgi:hypothetical protein
MKTIGSKLYSTLRHTDDLGLSLHRDQGLLHGS